MKAPFKISLRRLITLLFVAGLSGAIACGDTPYQSEDLPDQPSATAMVVAGRVTGDGRTPREGAVVTLDGNVEAYLRASEVSRDRVEDIRSHLKEGDQVSAMIINIDRKNRNINLSVKAKDAAEEAEAVQQHSSDSQQASAGTTNLGALLKAKLGK